MTLWVYEQTSGFTVHASLTLSGADDTLAALPSLSSCAGCAPDFGHLLAFSFSSPIGEHALRDFREPDLGFQFPSWSISPSGIAFITEREDFFVDFPSGRIQVDADNIASPCGQTGACVAYGTWVGPSLIVDVAEPFGSGIALCVALLVAAACRRAQRTS